MPQANIFSLGINLKEAVKRGQLVSMTGELATTGSKEPIGVAQYDGKAGERIPAVALGLADITATGLAVGDGVKANAGNAEKATGAAEAFAFVHSVEGSRVEIFIK